MQIQHCARGCVFFFVAMLMTSCGGNRIAEVHGAVRFNGEPIEQGSILFVSTDGQEGTEWGSPIKNGNYSAKVPAGPMKVRISWLRGTGKKKKVYDTPESPVIEEMEEVLPAKYNSQTELQFEVKSGANKKDWDLTK